MVLQMFGVWIRRINLNDATQKAYMIDLIIVDQTLNSSLFTSQMDGSTTNLGMMTDPRLQL